MVCLVLVMSAAGCGVVGGSKEKVPVEFGSARPGPAIALPAPAKGDVIPADKWPGVCRFLSDEEITALLPQATDIVRKPKVVSVLTLDDEQRAKAPEGACTFQFWLKGATNEEITSSVDVGISGLADPEVVAAHYTETLAADRKRKDRTQVEDYGARLGPEACYSYLTGSYFHTLVCRQGPLVFHVDGIGFGTFPGVPEGDLPASGKHWRDKVQAPVAGVIAAKISR